MIVVKDIRLPFFEHQSSNPSSSLISFELPVNKISFVLGANGSGKSTLLKVLLGFLKPLSGNCSTSALTPTQRAKQIAWIDQSNATEIAYCVTDVVGMSGANADIIKNAMQRFAIMHLANKPLTRLSGGEQRRVHLARAFAQSTPWLLMDEPTSHLDISHELQLLASLGELVAQDRSVLMATHSPAHIGIVPTEALGLVFIMDHGELVLQCKGDEKTLWFPKLCDVLGVSQAQLKSLSRLSY
jgi:ABC-type cobalamin/Fe3+-siderophores transport system ATPase subunit